MDYFGLLICLCKYEEYFQIGFWILLTILKTLIQMISILGWKQNVLSIKAIIIQAIFKDMLGGRVYKEIRHTGRDSTYLYDFFIKSKSQHICENSMNNDGLYR